MAVVTDTGTAGDALDNAFFVLEVRGSQEYLKRLPPTDAYFFLPSSAGESRLVRLAN